MNNETRNAKKVAKEIKDFKVQGANQIALYGLDYLATYVERHGFDQNFDKVTKILKDARPTAAVLYNCVELIRKKRTKKSINNLRRHINSVKSNKPFPDWMTEQSHTIMTYCHSGETMNYIRQLHKRTKLSVFASITQPLRQGIKTAIELAQSNIPVTLIGDNALGFFVGDVDAIFVGADALRPEGLVNKVGTMLLAMAAFENKKPFYVVANSLKVDTRKEFVVEERPITELIGKLGHKDITLDKIDVRNPAFDITPWKYVSYVITEKGISKPKELFVAD